MRSIVSRNAKGEMDLGTIILLAVPICLVAFSITWIAVNGAQDREMSYLLVFAVGLVIAEVMYRGFGRKGQIDTSDGPAIHHDDWMREGGM